jgi:4-aminobutyrate aminotransferase
VRGKGLMVGVEFRTPDGKADKDTAKAVVHACQERRMLLLTCGAYDNVIRWIPPLVVSAAEIAQGLGIFEEALADL